MRKLRMVSMAVAVVTALVLGSVPVYAQEQSKQEVRVAGKITSISGNTFSLKTPRRGELKVQHDSQTQWFGGSASDLRVDLPVAVAGTLTNETLHASKIGLGEKLRDEARKRRDGVRRKHRMIRGEITSVSGHEFNLKTRRGELKVVWNEQTKFLGGSAEDLVVGAQIGVAGTPSGSNASEAAPSRTSIPTDQRTVAGVRSRQTRTAELPSGAVIHAKAIAFKPACEGNHVEGSS